VAMPWWPHIWGVHIWKVNAIYDRMNERRTD